MYGLLRPRYHTTPAERFDQRADMCSLCDALHLDYGISGRVLNNYDAIFLATLTAAQNPELRRNQLDPQRGACTRFLKAPNYKVEPYFELAANISVLIAALRLGDRLTDAKGWATRLNPKNRAVAKWLKPRLHTARQKAAKFGLEKLDPQQATLRQQALEAQPGVTLEELAQVTAEWLAEILAVTSRLAARPQNEQPLRQLGLALGRQIYIFDALDDLDDDLKSGDFNALLDTGSRLELPNRQARRTEAEQLGQRLLLSGRTELVRLLEAVTLEDNAQLVRGMLLDNRMLRRLEPALSQAALHNELTLERQAGTSQKLDWQLPLINRTTPEHASTCKSKRCQSKKSAHRVGFLGVAIGLAALPLQMNGCDCCCDICAAEEGAACCCLEVECCSCCCNGCGGGGGGRRYRGGYDPRYGPPPGYYPPRRRRWF